MNFPTLSAQLQTYQGQLDCIRRAWGGEYTLPETAFFLFGMGSRPKLLYQNGTLQDSQTGEVLRQWNYRTEIIVPSAYTVAVETHKRQPVVICEDENAIWLIEGERPIPLSPVKIPIHLPYFESIDPITLARRPHPYALVLRVLLQEILVNIVAGRPLPNYFVYPHPWYRDAAMTAMVLKETGNLGLIRDWILGLREPFDRNNASEMEVDNLGEVLYLISLVSDDSHPLVQTILDLLPHFHLGKTLTGRTDFATRPVYQTKWLKYGLRALDLLDTYEIPMQREDYSALFWWDFKEQHIPMERMLSADYPYLTWACDSFYGERNGLMSNRAYPLTWETNASRADYSGISIISGEYTQRKIAAPHTWHAVEMFFRLRNELN